MLNSHASVCRLCCRHCCRKASAWSACCFSQDGAVLHQHDTVLWGWVMEHAHLEAGAAHAGKAWLHSSVFPMMHASICAPYGALVTPVACCDLWRPPTTEEQQLHLSWTARSMPVRRGVTPSCSAISGSTVSPTKAMPGLSQFQGSLAKKG